MGEHVLHRAMDAAGNVFRRPDMSDRRYGAGGRLEESEGTRYEHDEDGNLTRKVEPDGSGWRYRWDGAGMLTEVERPDGKRVRFSYDPFARRTRKMVVLSGENAEEIIESDTRFVWDGSRVLHEIPGAEDLITWYWKPGTLTPVAKEQGDRQWNIAADHLGTPTEMYDEQGELVWQAQLDVFGEARFEMGRPEDCPWRRPGQYADASLGESYNHWRWYSPSAGVYRSQDPLRLDGGTRPYGYPLDPMMQFDPFGLVPLDATGYSVYHITDRATGDVVYVGITNDVARRQIEHTNSGRLAEGFEFTEVRGDLTYAQARGFEQADIAHYGTRDTGRIGQPIEAGEPNRCWSYDPARTDVRARAFQEHEQARRQSRGGCS
jgi:RHS repeat-associated protein